MNILLQPDSLNVVERVEHIKKDWHLLLQAVIKQYNNTIHDSTKFKPVDAITDSNAPDVKTHSFKEHV